MTVNPDGTIQEIRIDGVDTGNPHFGTINASYVLNRGYDYLQWTSPTTFEAGFYEAIYTPVNSPTDVRVNTFRVVGTAVSADRIEATWSIFGYHSYVDAVGDWQYQQYAWQGGTLVAESGGPGLTSPELDYDGDGVSDLAVYEVVGGLGLWSLQFTGGGAPITGRVFGDAASVPVRGDFNGDGSWDMAVYRSNGWWYVSTDLGFTGSAYPFGDANSIPAPGDYDGDGITDLAVYQRLPGPPFYQAGQWFIFSLAKGFLPSVQWGDVGYIPAPADYDGDGTTDVAVYNPTTGVWYVLYSGGAAPAMFIWGNSACDPLANDVDGDGSKEFTVYHYGSATPAEADWFMSSYLAPGIPFVPPINFGDSTSTPVSGGDFDGDGRDDTVVYKDGQWYIWNSSLGTVSSPTLGSATARPIPQFHK
jgi:hypothetical protein